MVNRNKIEAAVLEALREVLKAAGYWKHYLNVYNDERRQLASGAARDRAKLETRAPALGGAVLETCHGWGAGNPEQAGWSQQFTLPHF